MPFHPCGKGVDAIRSCYSTRARLWQGDDTEVPIRWFFVDEATPMMEGPTPFCSRNWDRDDAWPELGEVQGAARPWKNGMAPAGYLALRHCGSAEAWQEGGRHGVDEPIQTNEEGYSPCCAGEAKRVGPALRLQLRAVFPQPTQGMAVRLWGRMLPPFAPRGPFPLAAQLQGAQGGLVGSAGLPLALRLVGHQGEAVVGLVELRAGLPARQKGEILEGTLPLKTALPATFPSVTAPSVRSWSAQGSTTPSMSVAAPAGLANGDHIIAIGEFNCFSTGTQPASSGFTIVHKWIQSATRQVGVWEKTAGPSEPSGYTWVWNTGGGVVQLIAVKDWSARTIGTFSDLTGTTTHTAGGAGISLAANWLALACYAITTTPGLAGPTGFTLTAQSLNPAGPNIGCAIGYHLANNPAGSPGNATLTVAPASTGTCGQIWYVP